MERYVGAGRERPLAQCAQMNQADTGDDLMRPALQSAQHPPRLGNVGRFAHDFTFEEHQRVRAEHQRVGMFLGNGACLAMRIELAQFQRRQLFVENFRGRRWEQFGIPDSTASTTPRALATQKPESAVAISCEKSKRCRQTCRGQAVLVQRASSRADSMAKQRLVSSLAPPIIGVRRAGKSVNPWP